MKPSDSSQFIGAMLGSLMEYYSEKQILKMLSQKNLKEMMKILRDSDKPT